MSAKEIEIKMNFRIPAELADTFRRVAEAEDQTASQVLRRMIREYIAEHAQADMFSAPAPAKKKSAPKKRAPAKKAATKKATTRRSRS